MRRNIILLSILTILIAACSNDTDHEMINDDQLSASRSNVTYSGDVEGVSVLIFGLNNDDYYYQRSLTSGWIGNKNSTRLELGKYKFFFYRAEGTEIITDPSSFTTSTKINDIRFKAKEDTDPSRIGYVLPVNEMWLPESGTMANTIYTLVGNDTIKNNLTRAVSQVELYLKRGKIEGDEYVEIPFPTGKNIMENIEEVQLEIIGVGESVNYAETSGNKKTFYTEDTETSFSDEGFAYFEGPYVFPPEQSVSNSTVNVKLIPKSGTVLEGLNLATTVTGKLERNKKLSITIWLTSTYNIIDVDVDTSVITSVNNGDEGIWE